jgi:hypothetical protein
MRSYRRKASVLHITLRPALTLATSEAWAQAG